jgi:hypothetical protein
MMFTGTLIEDLMATVERATERVQMEEDVMAASIIADSWFASTRKIQTTTRKFLEWHKS